MGPSTSRGATTEMADLRSGGRPREPRDTGASPDAQSLNGRPLPTRTGPTQPIHGGLAVADSGSAGRTPPAKKPRPDPGPLRIAIGLTGVATASALVSAFLAPPVGGTPGARTTATETIVAPAAPQPVQHITRYVQLAPGQTAPPQAVIQQAPAPKPRVVIVTTKQSGG